MEQEVKQEVVKEVVKIEKKWENWHFHNTALLVLSLIVFFYLSDTPLVKNSIEFIGNFGYIGAFIAGILFVSVFTIAPASIVLFHLAENLNPLGIALAAGTGGLVGDYLILKFIRDKIFDELQPVFFYHGGKPLEKLFKTPYFSWAVPILGAIIIASPLPDEIGLGMLGATKMKTWKLMLLLYILDIVCIFLIVIAAKSF